MNWVKNANRLFVLCFLQLLLTFSYAQRDVIVDNQGVMRWADTQEEIEGFGVNYTTPFAHAYRSAKKLGIDPLRAIDEDVYHMARLGFDYFRVHVWDTEISDTLGNLIYNENFAAFDYLLMRLKERNINYTITPIAYWGGGWPEPDQYTPGFSHKYGKGDCLTNSDAIKAQENYLNQFINHVNPYTGIAYKDDPSLIAVEISNEPHHYGDASKVTDFVKRMVNALKKTGIQKPIFYNGSHGVHFSKNYFEGGVEGGTFQWYPTGLVANRELPVNALPNVDDYNIPFDDVYKKNGAAKLVYEFDAADIGRSYVYPAMARSFRTAGIQLATHFSYDPMFLAYANTEYNTHYMNLAYVPHKALSLMICSEVFHQIPRYKDFGSYPQNTSFDDFMVSYEQDLALYNAANKFYHTNHTSVDPKNINSLAHIAGTGNSPVVQYSGTGAYFLDKIEAGIWRLEVMPDPLIIQNPYGRNSLDKKITVIQWNERKMSIELPDLEDTFELEAVNDGNHHQAQNQNGSFNIRPGVYLLKKTGVDFQWNRKSKINKLLLTEFHAPKDDVIDFHLVHEPAQLASPGKALKISAQATSPYFEDLNVEVWLSGSRGKKITMEKKDGFTFEATIPTEDVNEGYLNYYLVAKDGEKTMTFPAGAEGTPYEWDFYERKAYRVQVLSSDKPIYLFDAQNDWNHLARSRWLNSLKIVPLDQKEAEYQVNVDQLFKKDNENLNGPVIHDHTIKAFINPKLTHIRESLPSKSKLLIKARSLNNKPAIVQIALTTQDGEAYATQLKLQPTIDTYELALTDLKKGPVVTMPRPYPTFLPYHFEKEGTGAFDITKIDGLQFSIGPGIPKKELEDQHGYAIVSVVLK
ncbi:MAG: hypothetical protein AAFO07_18560 [Bacteroidota bacterium]